MLASRGILFCLVKELQSTTDFAEIAVIICIDLAGRLINQWEPWG